MTASRRNRAWGLIGLAGRAVAVGLCTVVSAAAWAQGGGSEPPPSKSVTVRIVTRAPEPGKWSMAKSADGSRRVYACKPPDCSALANVTFVFQRGSANQPSPEGLEKFATVDLPKSIRAAAAAEAVMHNQSERIETLYSKATRLKDYPAVVNETQFTRGAANVYMQFAIIFAGPVTVRIEAKSPSRDLAKNSLEGFIRELQIVETPGPPPGLPKPPKTESL